jgi:hypothetical protein
MRGPGLGLCLLIYSLTRWLKKGIKLLGRKGVSSQPCAHVGFLARSYGAAPISVLLAGRSASPASATDANIGAALSVRRYPPSTTSLR